MNKRDFLYILIILVLAASHLVKFETEYSVAPSQYSKPTLSKIECLIDNRTPLFKFEHIESSSLNFEQDPDNPSLKISLNSVGKAYLESTSKQNLSKKLYIYFNKKLLSNSIAMNLPLTQGTIFLPSSIAKAVSNYEATKSL